MHDPSSPSPKPVLVVHVIAGLGLGGAETALARLVGQSAPAGFTHIVVSLSSRGDLASEIEAAGGTVVPLHLGKGLSFLRHIRQLVRRLRRLEPDIIQGWMAHGNLAAWLVRTLVCRRAALTWNLRMTLSRTFEKPRTLRITRAIAKLSRSVDLLISNSEASLREHLALGYRPRDTAVIPNGFDPSVFRPDKRDRARIRADLGLDDGQLVFGLVGRYHETKGYPIFIQAASRVAERYPDARFACVGPGTDGRQMNGLLEVEGLRPRFILLGARRDIPSIMRAMDVVCVPSLAEGFPNVLGEAMASSLPCIATDVSDVVTILGGTGKLVDIDDVEGLAAAMIEMIEIGTRGRAALGAKARERILRNYTLELVAAHYVERYRSIASARAGSDARHNPHSHDPMGLNS